MRVRQSPADRTSTRSGRCPARARHRAAKLQLPPHAMIPEFISCSAHPACGCAGKVCRLPSIQIIARPCDHPAATSDLSEKAQQLPADLRRLHQHPERKQVGILESRSSSAAPRPREAPHACRAPEPSITLWPPARTLPVPRSAYPSPFSPALPRAAPHARNAAGTWHSFAAEPIQIHLHGSPDSRSRYGSLNSSPGFDPATRARMASLNSARSSSSFANTASECSAR